MVDDPDGAEAAPAQNGRMLELYQTEWCPASHRVRQRLTELGLDFLARQVPADKDARLRLLLKAGTDAIPVLVDGSRTIKGQDAILAYLGEHFEDSADAKAHRKRAATARLQELQEQLSCLPRVTH